MGGLARRFGGAVLVGLLAAVLVAGQPAAARDSAPIATGSVSGRPVPRFVSLKADRVNVRTGPNKDQDVRWVYTRAGMPVEITAEFDNWRRIRDWEGSEGWVYHSLLSGKRTAVVVPTLKDGELILWESHAIIRYLSATYGAGNLWPESPKARSTADQWTDWTAMRFQPAWGGVFSAVARTKPEARDKKTIAATLKAAEPCFAILEAQLRKTQYLAGERLTYGDIAAGSLLYRWYTMDIEREPLAGVDAWHERLMARPAFVKGVCVDYDILKNTIGG